MNQVNLQGFKPLRMTTRAEVPPKTKVQGQSPATRHRIIKPKAPESFNNNNTSNNNKNHEVSVQDLVRRLQEEKDRAEENSDKKNVGDFKREIEKRFERSHTNKTYEFPRKQLFDNFVESDDSQDSMDGVTMYNLKMQNHKQPR